MGEGALLWGSGRLDGAGLGSKGGSGEEEGKQLRGPGHEEAHRLCGVQLGFCPSLAVATTCSYYREAPGARLQRQTGPERESPREQIVSACLPVLQALLSSTP